MATRAHLMDRRVDWATAADCRILAPPVDLRKDAVPRLIRTLALPASIGMLFSTLLAVTDTWYAGMLSPTALAALSLAGPVFFLVMTLGIGIGQATNALVGNRLGADEPGVARRLAMQSIAFAVLVSLSGAFIAFLATPWLFATMGGEAPYLEPATAYMSVVLLGTAFFALALVVNAILNTRGDTTSYRNAQIVAFVANLGLDPLFMFVLDLGVVGVAVATILVQGGVVAWLLFKALRLDFMAHPRLAEFVPHLPCWRDIARQSLPTSASMMLVAIGSLIIVTFVARFGESAMAAYGIALRIEQLILLPTIGINIAVLSMTGVNLGAREHDRVREIYRTGVLMALALMAIGAVVLAVFADQVMGLFTDDEEVRGIGRVYLYFEAVILPAYALTFLSAATLQGLKRPEIALWFNIVRQVAGQLVLFWLAVEVLDLGITGIWWSVLAINWLMAVGIVVVARRLLAKVGEEPPARRGGLLTPVPEPEVVK